MRLIDADRLVTILSEVREVAKRMKAQGTVDTLDTVLEFIMSEPTVDPKEAQTDGEVS